MGRGIIESGFFRTERVELEQRTSDPSSPEPGDCWVRTDVQPLNDGGGNAVASVGQLRIALPDGTVETLPVPRTTASTDDNVIDKVRLYLDAGTNTGTGFIPFATTGATYPDWQLEHPTDGRVSLHDALTAESALPDSVVDNFEAALYEDQGNTLSDYYNNINASYERSSDSPVIEGSQSLKVTADSSNVYSEPGDGLNRYISKGEIASGKVYDDNGEPKLIFGAANDGSGLDCYMTRHQAGGQISIEKWVDGGFDGTLGSTSVGTNLQEWYELEVEWHDGTGSESDNTIVVRLYSLDQSTGSRQSEVASVQASDAAYATHEGVGLQNSANNAGNVAAYDIIQFVGSV